MTGLSDVDRQRIAEVVRLADELATARDVDGYLALITSDMVLDGAQGTASGHDVIREAIRRIWAAEPPGTLHLTSDIVVTPGADGIAYADSTLSLARGTLAHPDVWAVASIRQQLRQSGQGWLIARRTVGPDPAAGRQQGS
jgi:ketosteroid isomerase-like protein